MSPENAPVISNSITILFSLLLIAMVVALALEEKIHAKKSLITATFSIVCVLLADILGILPLEHPVNAFGQVLHLPVYITGIDWEVIAVIVGSSLFVDVTSRSGMYTWVALSLTKRSGGDPTKLLTYYGVLTVLFSAFLNNVTAMIIIGSLTAVSLSKLKKTNLLFGFLLIEGTLTNIGGLLTLVSSVPNIIVGHAADISFVKFMTVSFLFVAVTSAVTIIIGQKLFRISPLTEDSEKKEAEDLVSSFDENDGISHRGFFYFSCFAFVALVTMFATASYLPYVKELGLGFVALTFGLMMLWIYKSEVDKFYSAIDWDLIWFFMTLFVVINTMEHAEVLHAIGHAIEHVISLGDKLGSIGLLWSSAIVSSVTDNIPLSAVLAKVLASRTPVTPPDSTLWWSVIFGANLGGNITPIGSASTLVAVTLMHKHKIGVSFSGFISRVLPFAGIQLLLASIYVVIVVPLLN